MVFWFFFVFSQITLIFCDDFQTQLQHIKSQATPDVQTAAVSDLIKRMLPEDAHKFAVKVNGDLNADNREYFHIELLSNDTVSIVGSTGVAVASGLNYYLKYYCNNHISWECSQLNISDNLPNINITITFNDRFRYYQNVCTTSYSFVWWNWNDWEKHIDWMALNSFNLVLAFNGQEAIWKRIYMKLNLTESEINEHFAGPAFLSWSRMGNIRGWGGPLSDNWHKRSLILQKSILKRMRDLGIVPVLPAFAGHVPKAFARLYPTAKMVEVSTWNRFNSTYCCPYLLDPSEQLFHDVGGMFMEEIINEFGTNHIYSCDTFNEMSPTTTNLTYINLIGRSIYKSMTKIDGNAVWLMQNWLFVHDSLFWTYERAKALLTSVPKGKMIVLDLQSEQFPQYGRFDFYFGQPFIWCMLHNFGGTLGMFGSSSIINKETFEARSEEGSTMIGTGITPEGINQNYVIYDLMTETSWRKSSANLTEWFINYARRRYGVENSKVETAWLILANTVYDFSGLELIRGKYSINRSPNTKIRTGYWYNICDIFEAWGEFVDAANDLNENSCYAHDLVDLTRQVLQVTGDEIYNQIIYSFKNKYKTSFSNAADQFLSLFDDMEKILATNEAFLLGKWLKAARNAAESNEEKSMLEYNARNQITLWGPNGEIKDYANKQWSGIVSHFFKPRWSRFLKEINNSLVQNKPFQEKVATRIILEEVEKPFTFDKSEFPESPIGDTIEVARDIYRRWWPNIHCQSIGKISTQVESKLVNNVNDVFIDLLH